MAENGGPLWQPLDISILPPDCVARRLAPSPVQLVTAERGSRPHGLTQAAASEESLGVLWVWRTRGRPPDRRRSGPRRIACQNGLGL